MILEQILAHKVDEVRSRKEKLPLSQLSEQARAAQRERTGARRLGFIESLQAAPDIAVIAEVKRASPSASLIREIPDAGELALRYHRAGARAVSVLTDERFFRGTLDDLVRVRSAVDIPVLRKDFIIDSYQICEAVLAGADAILLIAAAMPVSQLQDLLTEARDWGLEVLVEVHTEAELVDILENTDARLIGINNRNLKTFETRLETTLSLASAVPAGYTLVSESGIATRADVERLRAVGAKAVLVGESLVRSGDPEAAIARLLDQKVDAAASGPAHER